MNSLEKTSFRIEIAGITIEIKNENTNFVKQFTEYLAQGAPELQTEITPKDIEKERLTSIKTGNLNCSKDELEMLAACRKTAEELIANSTFLMHGAVIADGSDAFMFTAPSGTGKTTHIRKWLEEVPGAFVVNGDKPLIKVTDTEAIAYGTPWCGKEHLNTNIGVPLRAIVLMERSEDNRIESISFSQAFPTLLQQTYRPADVDKMRKTLSLLSALNGKVKFFRFYFNNLKSDAFRTSYDALTALN